jgi:hypothetical protein
MMRQIAGSFAEYEKARLVAKLKTARDAKKAEIGKCGGRKTYAEREPALVEAAKAIKNHGGRVSLRELCAGAVEAEDAFAPLRLIYCKPLRSRGAFGTACCPLQHRETITIGNARP